MTFTYYKKEDIAAAAEQITAGNLIAFPTETVYGLGADATNPGAVKKVYQAKGRPSDNPLIVHVADKQTVLNFVEELTKPVIKLMNAFWPGPLTIILPIKKDSLESVVTGGLQTAAFRMPDNQATLALIKAAKTPMVGPSANTSGKPSPTTAAHVAHDLHTTIAGVLDDGPTGVGVESTVLDMSVEQPVILRPGAITPEAIEAVIGPVLMNQHQVTKKEIPKAPGMKYKHYAPNAQVIIVEKSEFNQAIKRYKSQAKCLGLLAQSAILKQYMQDPQIMTYSLGDTPENAAQNLFAGLRYFDDEQAVQIILAQAMPNQEIGAAYMNRLEKAAGNCYFSDKK